MTNHPATSQNTTPESEVTDLTTEESEQVSPLIEIPTAVTVGDLSDLMNLDAIDIIKQLMRAGLMMTINEAVDFETAAMIAQSSAKSSRKSTNRRPRR